MYTTWAFGVVVMLLLSTCKTGEWTGDEAAESVVVIGDSLVFWTEQATLHTSETWLTDDLVAAGHYAYVTGWIGLDVDLAYPVVWNHASRQGIIPDVLVIALGTNDMHVDAVTGAPPTTPELAAPVLDAWLAEVPDACVRLIGVAESITGWGLDVTAPGWNAMLGAAAASHADGAFVPWEPLPEWTQNGVDPHLTTEGEDAYRALLVDAAASCSS